MAKSKKFALTRTTNIADIVEQCPQALELLAEYGLFCVNCFLNRFDTVETGAKIHHMSDEQIDKMIAEINSELVKPQKSKTKNL